MLLLLNKMRKEYAEEIRVLVGDEDKTVLLVGDAVFFGLPGMLPGLEELGVEEFYAAEDAVQARGLALDPKVRIVDYPGMAGLILDDHDQVVAL